MASPTAAGGRSAGAGGRACRSDAVGDGHADAGYRWSRGDPRIRADGRFAGAGRFRHDRQRLAGRPRSRLAAGMNDHVARLTTEPGALPARSSGRSGARGAPATAADAGELVEARGDIVGRFGGSPGADRPGVAALRSDMCRTSSPSSNASSARAKSRAAPRPCIPSRAKASTVGYTLPPPCQRAGAGPAPRRSAARAWKSSPASA